MANTKKTHKKAIENRQLFLSAYGSYRQKWESMSQQAYDFFLGDQLSEDEMTALEDAGMPTFIINRLTPVVEVMLYFCTDQNPKWNAVGADGSDSDYAAIHNAISEYCWHESGGQSIYTQAIRDSLVKGVGWIQVDIDANADRGMGDVTFKRVEPFDVYVDPMSTDFLFRDASFIQVKKNLSRSQLLNTFPEFSRKIKKAQPYEESKTPSLSERSDNSMSIQINDIETSYETDGSEDITLDVYETYKKVFVPYVNIKILKKPDDNAMRELRDRIDENIKLLEEEESVALIELQNQLEAQIQEGAILPERASLELKKATMESDRKIELASQEMMASAIAESSKEVVESIPLEMYEDLLNKPEYKEQIIDIVEYNETRIEVCVTVGDQYLYTYQLPCSEYPLIPFCYQHTGTPYPIGSVQPLVGKQQELNKAHQLLIHNANLSSNLRWMYEEGSIPEDEWESYASSPGALLKVRQGFNMPTPVQPLPLNNAFFSVTQAGKQDSEYLSGVYSSMQGDTKEQPETYRGLLATDEHGTRRIKQFINNHIEPALQLTGKVFMEFAQDLYDYNKVFRISQPNTSGVNEVKEYEINIPIYDDFGDEVSKYNNYAEMKFDVKVVAGATLPVNRFALVEEYFRWFQAGLIDDIAMLKETDIRGKEQIVERKSMLSQLQKQIAQMEEQLKDKEDSIESLSRQLVQSGIRDKVKDAKVAVDKEVNKTIAEQTALRDKVVYEGNRQLSDLKSSMDEKSTGNGVSNNNKLNKD